MKQANIPTLLVKGLRNFAARRLQAQFQEAKPFSHVRPAMSYEQHFPTPGFRCSGGDPSFPGTRGLTSRAGRDSESMDLGVLIATHGVFLLRSEVDATEKETDLFRFFQTQDWEGTPMWQDVANRIIGFNLCQTFLLILDLQHPGFGTTPFQGALKNEDAHRILSAVSHFI